VRGVQHRRREGERLTGADRQALQRQHAEAERGQRDGGPDGRSDAGPQQDGQPSSGVNTTYMPVTKPDTEAEVDCRPTVCSTWAPP
jgi:hypothetical protein